MDHASWLNEETGEAAQEAYKYFMRPDPNSIVVDHGTPDLAALRAFFEERRFESFLLGFDSFVRVFPAYRNITEVAV